MSRRDAKLLRVAYNFRGPDAVADAVTAVGVFCRAAKVEGEAAARLAIVVEELVANIFEHGGLEADECVEMNLSRLGGEVSLTLEDRGHAFDPRASPIAEINAERGGGSGLALVNAWTRMLSYQSSGDVNRLELVLPVDNGDLPPADGGG